MDKKINYKKIIQALNYISTKQPNNLMNKMKAYKLLCLADRYHIRQYGRSITNDVYCALPYGTVPSNTMNLFTGKLSDDDFNLNIEIVDNYNYKSKSAPNLKVFSKTDLEAIDIILEKFNHKTEFELSQFSHIFPEWKRFENDLNNPSKANSYKIKESDFFLNVDEDSGLFKDDEELLSLTKELYTNN